VEWSHRWTVRGHWRNQPYGPGRTKIRAKYIRPFVKGPPDERTLARRIRVPLQTVQRWLAGTHRPSTTGQIARLAAFARIPSHTIARVAWYPSDPPTEHESDDACGDAVLRLHWRDIQDSLNRYPEQKRDEVFQNYLRTLRDRVEVWRPAFRTVAAATWREQVAALMAEAPSDQAQLQVAHFIAAAMEPIRAAFDLPPYTIQLTRRRTVLGFCHQAAHEEFRPHAIHVRCAPPLVPDLWLALPTMVYVHCHEMSHLRHWGHKKPFWDLARSIVDAAASAGIYESDAVPREWDLGQGDIKLAGSAAAGRASAARAVHRNMAVLRAYIADLDTPVNRAAAATLVLGGRYRLEKTRSSPQLIGALVTVRAVESHWAACELDDPELADGRAVVADPTALVLIDAQC
jgi:Protein of unknown function DUF45